jgi:hypothetical protein
MKLYDDARARLNATTGREMERLNTIINEFEAKAEGAKATLEARTREYLASGVAYNCMKFQSAMSLVGSEPKDYFKALAKELDRPFIYAYDERKHGYWNGSYTYLEYTQLIVPATNRLKNVVAGLNLVADQVRMLGQGAEVTTDHSDRTWRFNFEGDGITVLEDFITTCRDNPVMRITLGVRPVTLGGNNAP